MLGLTIYYLLFGLGITYGATWLVSIAPSKIQSDLYQFFVPFIAQLISYLMISYILRGPNQNYSKSERAKKVGQAIWIALAIAIVCYVAWYYFSFIHYTNKAVAVLAETHDNPLAYLNGIYQEEFGASGFWGYLLSSAKSRAIITTPGEPIEISSGWWAFVLNWFYRIFNLAAIVIAVGIGWTNAEKRAKEEKASDVSV